MDPPPRHSLKIDPILVLILVFAVFLLFFRLDHRPFWQDEAETACLARNVLTYGVPRAYDGVNLVSQELGREFRDNYLWCWSPWLQIYVTAAAFRLGGLSTYVGRLPFALAGLACIWLVYLLIRRRFDDLAWARLSAALLTLSVPFLLFSRQCRYYSLGGLLVLVSLYAFLGKWQSRTGPAVLLVGSLVLLFHTNYLLFFSFTGASFLAAILVFRQELPLRRTLILMLVTAFLLLPSLWLYHFQKQVSLIDLTRTPGVLARYFIDLFQFMLPLPIAIGLLWKWRRFLRHYELPDNQEERFVLFLAIVISINIVILSITPNYFHRYLFHLYPLCMILLGWVCCKIERRFKFCGITLAILIGATNLLHLIPMDLVRISKRHQHNDAYMLTSLNIPLKLYFTELSLNYPDVNRVIIRSLQQQGKPKDTVLVTYNDLPLQFYTDFKVLGGLQGRLPANGELPDWVVDLRRNPDFGKFSEKDEAKVFIRDHLRLSVDYEAQPLDFPNDYYGNRADPYHHHFVSPPRQFYPRVVLYRKKTGDLMGASLGPRQEPTP